MLRVWLVALMAVWSVFSAGATETAPPKPIPAFPSADDRLRLFDRLNETVRRIDGEALPVRARTEHSWNALMAQLRREMAEAKDWDDFAQVLRRVNAAYPNLHAFVALPEWMDWVRKDGYLAHAFVLRFAVIDPAVAESPLMVAALNEQNDFEASGSPISAGDEVVAINGVETAVWRAEGRKFCKYPLAWQCDLNFFDSFRRELLGWDRRKPLTLEVKTASGARRVATFSRRTVVEQRPRLPRPPEDCETERGRYPEGFVRIYRGRNLCAFEKPGDRSTVILRLSSFLYFDSEEYKGPVVKSVQDEADLFWRSYWQTRAPSVATLVLDVIGNGGGNEPIALYALFLDRDYQEQFWQLRRFAELDDPAVRKGPLWDGSHHETWFRKMKTPPEGDYYPPVAQFCPRDAKACEPEILFKTKRNGFTGGIKLLVDPRCTSSCGGFIWQLRDKLRGRVESYGLADNADTNFSRIAIVLGDPVAKDVALRPHFDIGRNPPDGAWAAFVVSVSRTTDAGGNELSGYPLPVEHVVRRTWDQTAADWTKAVAARALQ